MKQKIIKTIQENNLINKGDSIVIGLSGGADSVFLALILNEIKDDFNLKLKAVHINHQLRGDEANRDMLFCENLCKQLEIEFVCFNVDVKSQAKEQNKGIEEMAREIRYECFKAECENGKIATAHNLDDLAETLIFNITRGSGVLGLGSIPIKRDNIIRPILYVSREEIEQYLEKIGQDFVVDSTNLTDEYSRNKIRHNVIPVLKEINPNFLQSVKRLTENAKMQSDFIDETVEGLFENDVSAEEILNQPKAIIFEFVKKLLSKNNINADNFHINECVNTLESGGRCQLPKDFLFSVKNNKITIAKNKKENIESFEIPFELSVKTPYNKYNAKIISIEEFNKNNQNVYNLFLKSAVDYDKIQNSAKYRNRLPGDKIYLKGRKVNKLLKTVYNELKIPSEVRDYLAVLTDGEKIVWAEGVGVNADYAVDKNTKKVLVLSREVDYHK